MRGISPKPVDQDNIVDAMNKEIIPLLREMRRLLLTSSTPTPAPPLAHGETHEAGGSDPIDGDQLPVGHVPVNYAAPLALLDSHLEGIDNELGTLEADVVTLESDVADLALPFDFDNYHSPVAAYLFDGPNRTVDRSGNGHTLTPSGTMLMGPTYVAGMGATFFASTNALTSSNTAAFNLLGACTLEMVMLTTVFRGTSYYVQRSAAGELSDANLVYTLGRGTTTGVLGGVLWETGAGVDISAANLGQLPVGDWLHFVQARSSAGVLSTYVNGALLSATAPLALPTDGSSLTQAMTVGGSGSHDFLGLYFAVYGSELSSAQVLDLAQKRLGLRSGP